MSLLLPDRPSRLKLQVSSKQLEIPEGLLGLWALQGLDFQVKNDIFTLEGLLSFLGWCAHTIEEQSAYFPYLTNQLIHQSSSLRQLLSENILEGSTAFIPLFFYSVYRFRQDLQDSFNLSNQKDLVNFFSWMLVQGYDEYSDKPLFSPIGQLLEPYRAQYLAERQRIIDSYSPDALDFDEDWYLEQYPDVKVAIATGTFNNAEEHWLRFGQYESRQAAPFKRNPVKDSLLNFDEDWYLEQYPDIKVAISDGSFSSAEEHWILLGKDEFRMPAPFQSLPFEAVQFKRIDVVICSMV